MATDPIQQDEQQVASGAEQGGIPPTEQAALDASRSPASARRLAQQRKNKGKKNNAVPPVTDPNTGNPPLPSSLPTQKDSASPVFNPSAVGQLNLSDDPAIGLPTSDATIIAEMQGTPILSGYQTGASLSELAGTGVKPGQSTQSTLPVYKTAEQLLHGIVTMPRSQLVKLQQQMQAAGFYPQGAPINGIPDPTTETAYLKLLSTTFNMQKNGQMLTPDELLQQATKPGGTKTDVTTQVDLTDPMTARGVADAMFQNILGRAPTDEDIKGFTNALQGYETANPGVTETTQTVGGDGNVTRENVKTKTGGMGSSLSLRGGDVAAAEEYIDQTHGAEEAQVGIDTLAKQFGSLVGVA